MVLILAGMPCSGKTTMLQHAIEKGTQLFGSTNDPIFKLTKMTSIEDEQKPTEEKIVNNFWLNEADLIHIVKNNIEITNMVIHFDIYWFYMILLNSFIKKLKNHTNVSHNDKLIIQLTNENTLFQIFNSVSVILSQKNLKFEVKLLDIDYDTLCNRSCNRKSLNNNKFHINQLLLNDYIYNNTENGKMLYQQFISGFKKVFESSLTND